MKKRLLTKKWLITAILLSTFTLMSGCGKSDPAQDPNGSPSNPNGQPLPPGGGGVGGCIPITQGQIPFQGTNVRVDSANIIGGQVPGLGAQGSMNIGGAPTGGPYQRQDIAGLISMNVMINGQNAQAGTAYGTTGNLQGFVQLSQQTITDILYLIQIGQIPINAGQTSVPPQNPYNPYNPYNPGQQQPGAGMNPASVCVSGIAINSGVKANLPGYLYGTHVYLYLNNSQHGYHLYLSMPI